jgi:hypothetical protein
MKKLLIVPALLALFATAAAESRFFLAIGANYIRPADEAYRTVYGSQAIYPGISAAIRLVGGLCLTGSAGRYSKNGATPDLGLETQATQSYFTAGLGYMLRVSRLVCLEAGAGWAGLTFSEEALGASITGSRSGLMAEGGLSIVPEEERVFLSLKLGYLSAQVDDLDSELAGPQSVRLGGLRFAVSVGIQLFGND